jgi:hypothetical protein
MSVQPEAVGTAAAPLSAAEQMAYYYGLLSRPILVARSNSDSVVWEGPTGPYEYANPVELPRAELRVVGRHPICEVWEDDLSREVLVHLDRDGVRWTSLDVVRIGKVGKAFAPVVLWIGVQPGSLGGGDGLTVAVALRALIRARDIPDVEVEIRESVVVSSVGPALIDVEPAGVSNPIASVVAPLTYGLGLSISAAAAPSIEGTGGLFVRRCGDADALYLVTARHVAFSNSGGSGSGSGNSPHASYSPYDEDYDVLTTHRPRRIITLFGERSHAMFVESIATAEQEQRRLIKHWETHLKQLEKREALYDLESGADGYDADEDPLAVRGREALETQREALETRLTRARSNVREAEEVLGRLSSFKQRVAQRWADPVDRALGHVVLAPAIQLNGGLAGADGFTLDIAVIEVDPLKVTVETNFKGNVMYLGTAPVALENEMNPDPGNRARFEFEFPESHLLKLGGIISDEDMRNPDELLVVMKRGKTSGLTVGHANNVVSLTRRYEDAGPNGVSKEWAILARDGTSAAFSLKEKHGIAFSDRGDSGAAVVDGRGRIGGLITGGVGRHILKLDAYGRIVESEPAPVGAAVDITYATPMSFILQRLEHAGFAVDNESLR